MSEVFFRLAEAYPLDVDAIIARKLMSEEISKVIAHCAKTSAVDTSTTMRRTSPASPSTGTPTTLPTLTHPPLPYPGFGDPLTTATKHNDAASAALVQLRYHYLSLPLRGASTGLVVHASDEESCEVLNALLDVVQEAEGVAIESIERVRAMIEDSTKLSIMERKGRSRRSGGKEARRAGAARLVLARIDDLGLA